MAKTLNFDQVVEERRKDHLCFHCPNGHSRYFPAESAEETLRRERDRLKQQIARVEDEARQAIDAEKRLRASAEKKLRQQTRRVSAGVCPCCNRTFQQLARHMASKHPEISKEIGHA